MSILIIKGEFMRCIFFVLCSMTVNEKAPSFSEKSIKGAPEPVKRPSVASGEKSEAYKSIFTSHSSAKRSKEESSNWITHTAYYF